MVSIIIPCYNHQEFVCETIESCLNQTVKPLEIIVVDDGSTDKSLEVALKYPVTVIKQPNMGLSAARNSGIRLARGKYCLPLDADDKIAETFLEKTIGLNDIVSVGQQEFGDSDNYWESKPTGLLKDFLIANQINCASLFKREIWERTGGYDEEMLDGYEDWDFWTRAIALGYKISMVNEPLFFYRKHGTSMVDHSIPLHDTLVEYMHNKYKKLGIIN